MDPYESPQLDPQEELSRPTPADETLAVEHLLLYVAGVAVAGFFDRGILEAVVWLNFRSLFQVYSLEPLFHGAGLGAIGLLVLRRIQRRPTFPAQFGHWLLLAQGANWLAERGSGAVLYQFLYRQTYDPGSWARLVSVEAVYAVHVLIWLLAAAVPALAIFYSQRQPAWQLYAGSLVLIAIGMGVQPLFGRDDALIWVGSTILIGLLSLVLFIAGVVSEFVQPQRRDQLHWTGVAFQAGVTIVWRLLRLL
jgi:hypothetical protein